LHYLVEEIGLDKVRDAVKNPLKMKIAAYYGPDMQREGACAGDDPFMPTYMEQLIEALGGTPVDYDSKCMSVGSTSMLTQEDSSLAMTAAVLSDAIQSGAELVVSACTISHVNLDSYQSKAGRVSGKNTSSARESPFGNRGLRARVLSRSPRSIANSGSPYWFVRLP